MFLVCKSFFVCFADNIQLKIAHKLLTSILALCTTNVKEAFQNFSAWINEGVDDLKFPQDLYTQVSSFNHKNMFYLFIFSSTYSF